MNIVASFIGEEILKCSMTLHLWTAYRLPLCVPHHGLAALQMTRLHLRTAHSNGPL